MPIIPVILNVSCSFSPVFGYFPVGFTVVSLLVELPAPVVDDELLLDVLDEDVEEVLVDELDDESDGSVVPVTFL